MRVDRLVRGPSVAAVLALALACFVAAVLTTTFRPIAASTVGGPEHFDTAPAATANALIGCIDGCIDGCTDGCTDGGIDDADGSDPAKSLELGEGVTDAPDGSAPASVTSAPWRAQTSGPRRASLDRRPPCLDGPRRPPRTFQLIA